MAFPSIQPYFNGLVLFFPRQIEPSADRGPVFKDFWSTKFLFKIIVSPVDIAYHIGHLYFTGNPGSVRINLVFCRFVPTDSEYMIKKELTGYFRVPGSSDQKTDFGRFG